MQFASDNIAKAEWKQKYAALMALGSIVEGPERVQLGNLFSQALPSIFSLT